jgi:hypothetical protein
MEGLMNRAYELLLSIIGVALFNYIILFGIKLFNNGLPIKGLRRNDAEYG